MQLNIKQAFSNLISARLRSILAILGILVGTGSVVALIYSGNMATEHALSQFKSLGTNIVAISMHSDRDKSKKEGARKPQLSDMEYIKNAAPHIQKLAPYTSTYTEFNIPGSKKINGQLIGISKNFPSVLRTTLTAGRYVNEYDNMSFYAVAGSHIAEILHKQYGNIIGKQIRSGDKIYTIVGELGHWSPSYIVYLDMDNSLLVPLSNALVTSKYADITQIIARVSPGSPLLITQHQIQRAINAILPSYRINFRNPTQVIHIINRQRATLSLLLTAIASISLVVGGIGVMNIMLVSVTERRREIGLLMAIGANRKDILTMFLTESILLTLIGGTMGIILGVIIAIIIAHYSHWAIFFYGLPIILGFAVSCLVGILSGFYPALRASALDPIRVLHSD